ncbi:DUF1194 domain-containing protein [Skermanella sp. TT6]|uniref:DUF1194 domain-containing protein n=1 Tax=Skermanella cutis TaxID=2775420 RepID=A0ABX7BB20_9PROT|nr:DUF1194 domain-containing protein [Skermanella sp. TT6]QQP91571.1 DUF1194 domain-containing protein [Skermanella sp. TT6]
MKVLALLSGFAGLLALSGVAARAEVPVDLELVLAVDVSGSVNEEDAHLQRNGYARAINDRRVVEAIQGGALGRIAVTYVEWADDKLQRTVVDWRVIDGPASARAFSRDLAGGPTVTESRTSISALIDHCVRLFESNGFEGTRQVIDISGDGENNVGRPVTLARDDAVRAGIIINGLPILRAGLLPWAEDRDRRRHLDLYFQENVIGGPGSFVVVARDPSSFADAIIAKLLREIAALPEPVP